MELSAVPIGLEAEDFTSEPLGSGEKFTPAAECRVKLNHDRRRAEEL
jgi:hypothetical protein